MADAKETQTLAPEFRVRINGADLPPEAATDLMSVSVCEDVDAAGMFVLRLANWDMNQLKVTWSDHDLFAEGNEAEIQMGYVNKLEKLMVGEITGLEPEFHAAEAPMVTVRGYDRRHRLMRGRKSLSFTQVKDSDIASQIASESGLTAQVEATAVTLDYVLQHNQTDWEFLQDRARRIGYEVVVEDKTLSFRPRQTGGSEVLTLTREEELIEFYPRLTTMTQVGELAVRGWNVKDKAGIVGKAKAGDESTTMGGSASGPKATNDAFGQFSTASVDLPIFTQAEADKVALGRFNERALGYITGEGLCAGRTDLRVGKLIKLDGLGKRFSGLYYVTSTAHTYSMTQGYRTAFRVRRNAT